MGSGPGSPGLRLYPIFGMEALVWEAQRAADRGQVNRTQVGLGSVPDLAMELELWLFPRTEGPALPSFPLCPQGKWCPAGGKTGGHVSSQHLGCPRQEGEDTPYSHHRSVPVLTQKACPCAPASARRGCGSFLRGSRCGRDLGPKSSSQTG
jgi:hypothetical protein